MPNRLTDAELTALDREIAEKVMGWHLDENGLQWCDKQNRPMVWYQHNNTFDLTLRSWQPTRDRAQAMLVFEQFPYVNFGRSSAMQDEHGQPYYCATIWSEDMASGPLWEAEEVRWQVAMCLAARNHADKKAIRILPGRIVDLEA